MFASAQAEILAMAQGLDVTSEHRGTLTKKKIVPFICAASSDVTVGDVALCSTRNNPRSGSNTSRRLDGTIPSDKSSSSQSTPLFCSAGFTCGLGAGVPSLVSYVNSPELFCPNHGISQASRTNQKG